jgi:hypothetical protein
MGLRLICRFLDAGPFETGGCREILIEPKDKWDMGLFLWRHEIRHAVQIDAVFTQRFAMIGHIEH